MSEATQSGLIAIQRRRLQQLLSPGETLSQRVVRGGFWAFALRIANRSLTLIRTIVLARVLAPSDFGLMGIALLAMSALETFSQTGFQAALIQKKGDIRDYLDTAWTISALRGLVLFAVLFLAAPYIALFFDTPAATPLMRVIGVSMLLSGLTNIGVVYFQKELEFNKQFVYQFSSTVADLVVAITAALLLRSVWALVFGLLARNLVGFAVSYFIHPYRPRMRLEAGKAKELYGFGRWVFGSSILLFLITQGDDVFVGRMLGAAALGFYQMAYRVSNLPATEITHVISQVTFPTYSKLQEAKDHLRTAYLQTLQSTSLFSFPLAAGIAGLSPEFVRLFLGEKWVPTIPAMQVLAAFGAVRSMAATSGPLFSGTGNPKYLTFSAGIKFVCLTAIIYPLTERYGITGTAMATTLPVVFSQSYVISKVLKILHCRVSDYISSLAMPLIGSLLMLGVFALVKTLLVSDWLVLLLSIPMGVVGYLSFLLIMERLYEQDDAVGNTITRIKRGL